MVWLTRGQPAAREAEGRREGRPQESRENEGGPEGEGGGRDTLRRLGRMKEGRKGALKSSGWVGGRGALRNLGRIRQRGPP